MRHSVRLCSAVLSLHAIFLAAPTSAADSPPTVPVAERATPDAPYRRPLESFNPASRMPVIQVLSGDAVTILHAGRNYLVRLLGVTSTRAAATAELKAMLVDQEVYLIYESGRAYDDENRITAYVYRAEDGLLVNLDLIARGYCLASHRLGPMAGAFRASARMARAGRLGLWASGDLESSEAYSNTYHGDLTLTASREKERYEDRQARRLIAARLRSQGPKFFEPVFRGGPMDFGGMGGFGGAGFFGEGLGGGGGFPQGVPQPSRRREREDDSK